MAAVWTVYVLKCGDGTLYTGVTNDLARRLLAHGAGKASRYTRARLPVSLLYQEPARDRSAAQTREAAIKNLSRRDKFALMSIPLAHASRGKHSRHRHRKRRR